MYDGVSYLLYDTAGLLRRKTGMSVSLLPDGCMPSDVFGKSLEFSVSRRKARRSLLVCCFFTFVCLFSGLVQDAKGSQVEDIPKLSRRCAELRNRVQEHGRGRRYQTGQPIKYTGEMMELYYLNITYLLGTITFAS